MDDATWGMFGEGWKDGTGGDADHLKTFEDIDATLAVGFSMFTIDPSAHVDSAADTDDVPTLRGKVAGLPWAELEDSEASLRQRYVGQRFAVEHLKIAFDEAVTLRAAAKYGKAVSHVAKMSRHLMKAAGARPVELEVSVDETDTPTTPAEHYWVASELKRLGVAWVSLAPRFVGRFEKGVDYIGDLDELETDVAAHAAIARHFGPYKLSLHSGSDKFSVYPIAARLAKGLVHLKTAGTSYLEVLRTIAALDPAMFPLDLRLRARALRHRQGDLPRVRGPEPRPGAPADLDDPAVRQVLHVTFGSVLASGAGRRAARAPARRPARALRRGARAPPRPPPGAVRLVRPVSTG